MGSNNRNVTNPGEFQKELKTAYSESLGEDLSLTQDRQLDGVAEREGLTGKLSQNVVPSVRGTLVGREEARRRLRYFCAPGLNPSMNLRVLTGSQALVTTSNGGILIDSYVWKFVIDQENLCTAELNHRFHEFQEAKSGRDGIPTRDCP